MPILSRRSPKTAAYNFSKEKLLRLYVKEKLSTYSIAKKLGCDPKTVWRYLKAFSIPTRPRKVVKINKKVLSHLYSSGKSMKSIGQLYGICAAAVHRKIHAANIVTRNSWDANIKYERKDFSGNPEEKSYLIGFRIGDLNVKTRPDPSSSIAVKSGTTKSAQLELMTQLFGQYGHIWISGPHRRGEYQFETKLNRSFEFLLPKHSLIPEWIKNNDNNFWSFVAGYTDAEGNIGVYAKRAKFRLRSYDQGILTQIYAKMQELHIQSFYRLETESGMSKSGKVKRNQDCWGITVNHAPSLVILFNLLRSRLLHAKRVGDLRLATVNLIERGYLECD